VDERHDVEPAFGADPDAEWADYDAWLDREVAAGHDPDERSGSWEPEDLVPGRLVLGSPVQPRFGQGDEAGVQRRNRGPW
jgi:hypothetical protein